MQDTVICDNGICIIVSASLIGEQESAHVIKTAAMVSGQMFDFYNLLVMCFLYNICIMMLHQRIRGSDLKQQWRNSHYITSIKWAHLCSYMCIHLSQLSKTG